MSKPVAPRPLTIAPVLDLLAARECSRAAAPIGENCTTPGCMRAVAEAAGVDRRVVHRWAREGLTIDRADQLAAALDLHPILVWGVAAWNAAVEAHDDELDRRAVNRALVARG